MGFSKYSSPVNEVEAEQVEEPRNIITPNGPLYAAEGDWEVRHADGNIEKLSAEEFAEQYQGGSAEPSTVSAQQNESLTGEDSEQETRVTPEKVSARDSSEEEDRSDESDTSVESGKTEEKDKTEDKDSPL
jgi:hypothetical protein